MQAKIIAHYSDGRLVKGFSTDFAPNKPMFHIGTGPTDKGAEVMMIELKAVFFVKDFEGNPNHKRKKYFDEGEKVQGRKAQVTFNDGEIMVGVVQSYDPERQGFFLIPADKDANNIRVYIVSASIADISFS